MYYVTSDFTKEWTELDDVKPSLLVASRKIVYTFTGDLNKKIVSNPHFPGLERDYLRCQICRISYNSTIIPITPNENGQQPQFKATPERDIEANTESKLIKIQETLNIKNWVHFVPSILKEGRLVHLIGEPPQDVEPEEYKKQIEAKDKFDEILAPIIKDKSLTSSIPNITIPPWKLEYMYDDKIYINPNIKQDMEVEADQRKDNTISYTIVCLKNLRWPGTVVVRIKGEIYNFYFGWGRKFVDSNLGEKFVFKEFEKINVDVDEVYPFPEPNSPVHEVEKQPDGVDVPQD
jgi:radial spoke head protein 4A